MNDRIRRPLIFGVIVGAGTLFIFFDLPLLLILPLILAIGLVLLILLGALPVAELKAMLSARLKRGAKKPVAPSAKPASPAAAAPPAGKARRFPFGLDALWKKPAAKAVHPGPPAPKQGIGERVRSLFAKKPSKAVPKTAPAVRQNAGAGRAKSGLSLHLSSLIGSIKALGTILTTKKKTDPDKLKKIDTMLDYAVSEKPNEPSPAPPSVLAGGGGPGTAAPPPLVPAENDPFLSLSDDELDTGLLDDLEDDGTASALAVPAPEPNGDTSGLSIPDLPDTIEDLPLGEPEISPSPEEAGAGPVSAEDILKQNESSDSAELPSLEGIDTVDENLGELDNLNLDAVELDDEDEDEEEASPAGAAPAAAPAPASGPPAPAAAPASPPAAPGGGGSGRSDQSEMAAFAAASGGDDDMLSSLAADIKSVKKEQDLSLLRELKDFRAPGTTLETELTELYGSLNAASEHQKKIRGPAKKPQPAAGKTPARKKPAPK